MKYSELIQFDEITTIVQLRDSEDSRKAKKLVESYVVSDTMKERLIQIVFKQLDWTNEEEHKGMLIVGNYGTGKSHLMSFISSIASDASFLPSVKNAEVRSAAEKIAGKFNVIRSEIGAVKTSFRTIFIKCLQKHLDDMHVKYRIPTSDTDLVSNKGWMAEMMKAYRKQYPNKGLLFVLDEMLDYLRALPERELVLALGVMREIGEFANAYDEAGEPYRFYFIGGVQEAIFDSGRFAFVSESLGRVAARFKQVPIDRADVKFVIAERLLKKNAAQLEKVGKLLEPFSKCYEAVLPQMDEFKRMFPVHPEFVSIFEKIACVEKRRILDTLSGKMEKLLNQDVPSGQPGLITFDTYWADVKADATAATNPDTKSVIDAVNQLDAKIDHGTLHRNYIPLAHRVVNALAVHRLSTDAIDRHIGLTAEELRDKLFIYDPTCAKESEPANALRDQISVVMKKLMLAVDGQYITKNPENDQYYIDVSRTVDFEQVIEKKAETLDTEDLDNAYFEALSCILEVKDVAPVVTNYRIWEYDKIEWFSHKTSRRGYLFFGAPNERSTAQPPRDYYIYFLRPFDKTTFHNEKRSDEVFFELSGVDDVLKSAISKYAAAIELAATSSGQSKATFEQHARIHLDEINKWLRTKGLASFMVTYKGSRKSPQTWQTGVNLRELAGLPPNEVFNLRDQVHALSGVLLEECFKGQAPDYPIFSKYITAEARMNAVKESLRTIAGMSTTKQSLILLDGLKLLDGSSAVTTSESPFAEKVRARLKEAGVGKVVNRVDLLVNVSAVPYFDPKKSRLEPELLVLILAAMVQTGEIVLSIPGRTFGATDLDKLSRTDVADLINFQHISKPKGGNIEGVTAAFRLLGVNVAYVAQLQQFKTEPVIQFSTALSQLIQMAAQLLPRLGRGVTFLDQDLLAQCGLKNAAVTIRTAKELLERLNQYNTPAKMLAMSITAEEIQEQEKAVWLIPNLKKVVEFCDNQIANVGYLDKAAEHTDADDTWHKQRDAVYTAIEKKIVETKTLKEMLEEVLPEAQEKLHQLEESWRAHYMQLHTRARLDAKGDVAKQKVLNLPIRKKLHDLAQIEIVPKPELQKLEETLANMCVCKDFDEAAGKSAAICPYCHYSPKNDGTGVTARTILDGMPTLLEKMLEKWTQLIIDNLGNKGVQEQMELLAKDEKKAVQEFEKTKVFPDPIPMPLLNGLRKVMGGLEKVVIRRDDLFKLLTDLGPCEVGRLKTALDEFFDARTNGRDLDKLRFVVE